MQRLEWCFGLGKDRNGRELSSYLDVEKALGDIVDIVSRTFGGCTLLRTTGSWDDGNGIVTEPGGLLFTDCDIKDYAEIGRRIARMIREALYQNSVHFVIHRLESVEDIGTIPGWPDLAS